MKASVPLRRGGFSYLEVAAVVMIVGIMAAIAAPQYARSARHRNTRNAAILIADQLHFIRSVAVNEGRTTTAVVNQQTDVFESPSVDFADRKGTSIRVAVKSDFDSSLELSASFDDQPYVQFDYEGNLLVGGIPMTAGSIVVASTDVAYEIVVESGTGITSIGQVRVPDDDGNDADGIDEVLDELEDAPVEVLESFGLSP